MSRTNLWPREYTVSHTLHICFGWVISLLKVNFQYSDAHCETCLLTFLHFLCPKLFRDVMSHHVELFTFSWQCSQHCLSFYFIYLMIRLKLKGWFGLKCVNALHAFQLEMWASLEMHMFHFEMHINNPLKSVSLLSWELVTGCYHGRPVKCAHFMHIGLKDPHLQVILCFGHLCTFTQ